MATVRFSDKLKADIRSNVRQLYRAEEEAARRIESYEGWADKIWEREFDHLKEKFDGIPEGFIRMSDALNLHLVYSPSSGEKEHYHLGRVYFKDSKYHPVSGKYESSTFASIGYHQEVYATDDPNCRYYDLLKVVKDFKDRQTAIENKIKSQIYAVNEIMNAFSTLAPALRHSPALWELLPEYAKQRHKEPVERKKREKPQVKADLGDVATRLAKAKMGLSNNGNDGGQ